MTEPMGEAASGWPNAMNVLIVDDQPSARRILADILSAMNGISLFEAASKREALKVIETHAIDVALVDIRLDPRFGIDGDEGGLDLIGPVRERGGVTLVVTAFSEMAEIRQAIRRGAADYILKDDLCADLVLPVIEEVRSRRSLEREVLALRSRSTADAAAAIVGASPAMSRLRSDIGRVALSRRPALVRGPTGAGKELVVRALHALGTCPDAPLLDVNCGAIPEPLMESMLFGHERGAFTGAERKQQGYLSAVGQGTLFLDEIAELPGTLQTKLLRTLETGRFRPIGAMTEQQFKGRVIAATHADLEQRVVKGHFREDLFYRLNVLVLNVPGLADRLEDIPALVSHFVSQQERRLTLTQDALDLLVASDWPGNVRQLRNLIDRAAVFAEKERVTRDDLLPLLHPVRGSPGTAGKAGATAEEPGEVLKQMARALLALPFTNRLEGIETALLEEAMALSDGNKSAAARLLGVHRKAVERRLCHEEPVVNDEAQRGPPRRIINERQDC